MNLTKIMIARRLRWIWARKVTLNVWIIFV